MHRHIHERHILKEDGLDGVFSAVEPVGDGGDRGQRHGGARPHIVEVDGHHLGVRIVAVDDGIAGVGLPQKEWAARRIEAAVVQLDPGAAREEIHQPRVIGMHGSRGKVVRQEQQLGIANMRTDVRKRQFAHILHLRCAVSAYRLQ